jgi:hypothetical protein
MQQEIAPATCPPQGDRLFHLRGRRGRRQRGAAARGHRAVRRAHNPLFEQLGSHFETASAGARRSPSTSRGRGDRRTTTRRAPGCMQRHLQRSHDRFTAWQLRARRAAPATAVPEPLAEGPHDAGLPHPRRATCASRDAARAWARTRCEMRLGAGGICGSDLHYFQQGRVGAFVMREPLIPGHEASGVVAAPSALRSRASSRATRWPSTRRTPAGTATTAAAAASTCAGACSSSAAPACSRMPRACSASAS